MARANETDLNELAEKLTTKKENAVQTRFVQFKDHKKNIEFYLNPAQVASLEPAMKGKATYIFTTVNGPQGARSYLVADTPLNVRKQLEGLLT